MSGNPAGQSLRDASAPLPSIDAVRLEAGPWTCRELRSSDIDAIAGWSSDPSVVRYMQWGPHARDEAQRYLDGQMTLARETPRLVYTLAVSEGDAGDALGAATLRIEPEHRRADVGYVLARAHWGRGIMRSVIPAVVSFATGTLALHRVWAYCDVENVASARVLEAAGMEREGLLRDHHLIRGAWRSSYVYGLVSSNRSPDDTVSR